MVLYNSQQMENGQALPLKKGKLQIQSEGAEVFYKDIKIRSLAVIPSEFLKWLSSNERSVFFVRLQAE